MSDTEEPVPHKPSRKQREVEAQFLELLLERKLIDPARADEAAAAIADAGPQPLHLYLQGKG